MRATITMPLETLKAIIERAREFEFVDEGEEFDETDLELEDEDAEEELDEGDDEEGQPILVANDDESDDEEATEDDDLDEDEEAFEDVLVGLTSEELSEILALAWMGEGDYDAWDEAMAAARALSTDDIIVELAENPTLSEAIERGLVALGYQITDA